MRSAVTDRLKADGGVSVVGTPSSESHGTLNIPEVKDGSESNVSKELMTDETTEKEKNLINETTISELLNSLKDRKIYKADEATVRISEETDDSVEYAKA